MTTSWRVALPLCFQPPCIVDWKAALDHIILIASGTEDVISAELGRVLNGASVSLKYSRVFVKGEIKLSVWGCLTTWVAMRMSGGPAWLPCGGDGRRICNGAKARVPARSEDV